MRAFEIIVKDPVDGSVFQTVQAAKSRKALLEIGGGNGEFISVKDITSSCFKDPDKEDYILQAMKEWNENHAGKAFSEAEMRMICEFVFQQFARNI